MRRLPEPAPGSEFVRKVREQLGAVLADEYQVLEADAAERLAVATGLERDHVARDQRVGCAAEVRPLVPPEPDAVPERVVVALVELRARRFAALRRVAGALERLAGDRVDLLAVGARAHLGERAVERLARQLPVLAQLVRRRHP